MKYKILIVSLLSTLAMAFGEATACDRERPNGNPHRIATEKEIAEHEEEARRIAEQEIAAVQNIIDLMFINIQVGGVETVDLAQQFQTLTEGFIIQATSLKNSVNNLTTMLAEISGADLTTKIAHLAQETNKDKMTNEALRREIDMRKLELAKTNKLLDDVLTQGASLASEQSLPPETPPLSEPTPPLSTLPSITSPTLTTEEVPTSNLSSCQQELLSRKHQIGSEAWKLLGGENASLAAALFSSIQQNSGTVEILSLEKNSFTLLLNGKEQYYPYKF